MRVSKGQAAENRARILAETARMIREAGIAGVGVDALTKAAGLGPWRPYSQFGSKERLVEEALAEALAASANKTTAGVGVRWVAGDHRGAVSVANPSEFARQRLRHCGDRARGRAPTCWRPSGFHPRRAEPCRAARRRHARPHWGAT